MIIWRQISTMWRWTERFPLMFLESEKHTIGLEGLEKCLQKYNVYSIDHHSFLNCLIVAKIYDSSLNPYADGS